MTEQAENLILDILKKIQAELAEHRKRFDALESIMRKQRRDAAGMMVVGKALVGNFTEIWLPLKSAFRLSKHIQSNCRGSRVEQRVSLA